MLFLDATKLLEILGSGCVWDLKENLMSYLMAI